MAQAKSAAKADTETPDIVDAEQATSEAPQNLIISLDEDQVADILSRLAPEDPTPTNSIEAIEAATTARQERTLMELVGGTITGLQKAGDSLYGLSITIGAIQGPSTSVVAWIYDTVKGEGPGHIEVEGT